MIQPSQGCRAGSIPASRIHIKNRRKLFKQKHSKGKMFGKKKCGNCGEKIGSDFNFCPYCRSPLKNGFEEEEDWGLLGKNDVVEPEEIRMPMGLNTLFNSLVKNLN